MTPFHTLVASVALPTLHSEPYATTQSSDGVALLAATIAHLDARDDKCPRTVCVTHFHELTAQVLLGAVVEVRGCGLCEDVCVCLRMCVLPLVRVQASVCDCVRAA